MCYNQPMTLEELNRLVEQTRFIDNSLVNDYKEFLYQNFLFTVHSQKKDPDVLYSEDVIDMEEYEKYLIQQMRYRNHVESFSDMVNSLLRIKAKKAPEIYRAAGIDARHFSKIISNRDYKPTKGTVFALAIAFNLSIAGTENLLMSAGYTFDRSNLFDMSIRFFIERSCYDRKTIDCFMSEFNLPLLPQNWS